MAAPVVTQLSPPASTLPQLRPLGELSGPQRFRDPQIFPEGLGLGEGLIQGDQAPGVGADPAPSCERACGTAGASLSAVLSWPSHAWPASVSSTPGGLTLSRLFPMNTPPPMARDTHRSWDRGTGEMAPPARTQPPPRVSHSLHTSFSRNRVGRRHTALPLSLGARWGLGPLERE